MPVKVEQINDDFFSDTIPSKRKTVSQNVDAIHGFKVKLQHTLSIERCRLKRED